MSASIIYIMGVAGSGKTTIGKKLSAEMGIPFLDGDDFHSPSHKERMKAGHPLNDDDRKQWLQRINELAKMEAIKKGAIIACSALKKKYRTILSDGIEDSVIWIFLKGSYELIHRRMLARTDHFMPPTLLTSQFETLENPADALTIDISSAPDDIVASILAYLKTKR